MSEKHESTDSEELDRRVYNGIVFSITDNDSKEPPTQCALDDANLAQWFQEYPSSVDDPIIKIAAHQQQSGANRHGFDVPFPRRVIDDAIWKSEVYTAWTCHHSGGCAALLDDPVRLTLQTPNEGQGYPFVSLAMSKQGHIVKGIYTFDHPDFDPILMMPGEILISGWRSTGLPIISLPQAILRTHSAWLGKAIQQTLDKILEIEDILARPYVSDFSALQRTLHSCSETILNLERRSEWESVVIKAIEDIVGKLGYSKYGPWSALAPAKAAIALRRADLEVIPRRIESARIAINDNILQRAQLQGLELARATQRIAEATMNDSASMKTIAILTMIFLPGTAVASFFSMTMWNWSNGENDGLVSPWLWIYFVVATPLTIGVIALWYFWMRMRTRQLHMVLPQIVAD